MSKSIAKFVSIPAVTHGTVTVPSTDKVTMQALKAALPDYFNAPSLPATLAQTMDDSRKHQFTAQALARAALVAAHSGTVSGDVSACIKSLTKSSKATKGTAKTKILALVAGLTAALESINGAKNTLKSATIAEFENFAAQCEGEFLGYLTPIKPEKVAKPKATKSQVEKIIALIQSATLSAEDVKAIRAALSNTSEPALM